MTHTKDILAAELTKAGLHDMAALATGGYYHDFLSPLATPELQLAEDLARAGTVEALELRNRVIDGEFDASKEESDEWAASPEGQETMAMHEGQAMTDVIHCTPEKPWDGVRPTIHHRVIHHEVEEVGDQLDGHPGGDIVTMRCKVCGHEWRTELPQ